MRMFKNVGTKPIKIQVAEAKQPVTMAVGGRMPFGDFDDHFLAMARASGTLKFMPERSHMDLVDTLATMLANSQEKMIAAIADAIVRHKIPAKIAKATAKPVEEVIAVVEEEIKKIVETEAVIELTPQQKAAITRKANKAKSKKND